MLACHKELFSLETSVHYINCAYMSPLLKSVEAAGIEGLFKKRNPQYITPEQFFDEAEEVRGLFGRLVRAPAERMALIPSLSYGMGIVARNIKAAPGQKVVTVQEEFPSDVYTLHRICAQHQLQLVTVPAPEGTKQRGREWNQRVLEAITPGTALVNLSSVHWADGTVFDLPAIGKRAKEVGALFVVDGTQSVGAMEFDLRTCPVDALLCAGYKWLLGPYTSGVGYFGPYFDEGVPLEESWLNRLGSEDFRALVDYEPAYRPGAARYNMGEYSNFINLPMLKAALIQILDWTPAAIQQYCSALAQPLIQFLQEHGYWVEEEGWRSAHLFGVRLPESITIEAIQQSLAEHRVVVSLRGNALRLSPHVYNDAADMNALQQALTLR